MYIVLSLNLKGLQEDAKVRANTSTAAPIKVPFREEQDWTEVLAFLTTTLERGGEEEAKKGLLPITRARQEVSGSFCGNSDARTVVAIFRTTAASVMDKFWVAL